MAQGSKKLLSLYPGEDCPITYNLIGTIVPSIVLTDVEYKKWFYSNYIHLSVEPEFYFHEVRHPLGIFPDNYIRQLNSAAFSNILQEVYLPNCISELHRDNIIEFIIRMINQDCYALIWLDVSMLKGTKWYHNRKYRHWAFCVGYDEERRVIIVQDFNEKGALSLIEISYENFEDAFDSDIVEMQVPDSLGFCKILGKGNLVLLKKIPDFTFKADPDFLKQELSLYVDGSDIGKRYLLFLPYKENVFWGINVYEYLEEYLKVQAAERPAIDLRSFIALKEHKKIMCDRFKFFREQKIVELPQGLYCNLKQISKNAELLFLKLMKMNASKDQSILAECIDDIRNIKLQEEKTLTDIIKVL